MLELTGIASVLRGIGFLYWLFAIGLLALALWKGKGWRGKTLWALPVVCVFGYLPVTQSIEQSKRNAFSREAWAYWKSKCDTLSGEKIYKTFTGVKSVLVVKPLPPATEWDLRNQYWYGDPYSNGSPSERRDLSKASSLLGPSPVTFSTINGLEFIEHTETSGGKTVKQKITRRKDEMRSDAIEEIPQFVSRFGLSWEDISTPGDRRYWVAGSRLRVIDLADNSVVAERIGFVIQTRFNADPGNSLPWLSARGPNSTCPSLKSGTYDDRIFILNVLKSNEEK